jgi:hypothetical protein
MSSEAFQLSDRDGRELLTKRVRESAPSRLQLLAVHGYRSSRGA